LILVTGGAGFIGSAVVRRLLQDGHDLRVVDDLSKGQVNPPPDASVEFMKVDLRDKGQTAAVFKGVDVCFHLAAKIGGIRYFHDYPATILDDNNAMLSSVFSAAVKHGTKIVYISSSMVFERTNIIPSPEDAVLDSPPPVTHYGFSKLVGEYYCRAFHEQHGVHYTICRPFNPYGPGEQPEDEPGMAHVIPDICKKVLRGDYPLEIMGSGQQQRCFTYIDDIAGGIVTAGLAAEGDNEDFNISEDTPITITELAQKIWQICGRSEPFQVVHATPLEHDTPRAIPDATKSARVLDWRPKMTLDEGLRRTLDWMRMFVLAA